MRINLFQPSPPDPDDTGRTSLRQLAWFCGLSMASAAIVISVAYLLRGLLFL